MKRRRWLAWALPAVLLISLESVAQHTTVDKSEHNLSPGGNKGPNVCVYCHAPHNTAGVKGLWNHKDTTSKHQGYTSSTYREGPLDLTSGSASRLCLSCHDGTVALGAVNTSPAPLPTKRTLSSEANLGTDLSKDHPFGFDNWVRDDTLRDELFHTPRTTGNKNVKLEDGRLECTACHEPHTPDNDPQRSTMFLSINNAQSALCTACHDVQKPAPNLLSGWQTSAHAISQSTEGAFGVSGYKTVAEAACQNCHSNHKSGSARLLRAAPDENTCYPCHADPNSQLQWAQAWLGYDDTTKFMHPVDATGHDPNENLMLPSTPRHSKCWDCHNPHADRKSANAIAPAVDPSLQGATGVSKEGNAVVASNQYEVCFKCHADSPNKPQSSASYSKYGHNPVRQVDATNVRLDFNSQFARHNVTQTRSNSHSPSLRMLMLTLSGSQGRNLASGYLYCTDCHNGGNNTDSGGTGPNGPHISPYEHLLERRYDMNGAAILAGANVLSLNIPPDGGDALKGPFAMCNKCHDVARLLTPVGDPVFKHHASHVVQGGISCAVCHAPHGVQGAEAVSHAHSVNLDLSIVFPDPITRRLEINTNTRTCYVSCHFSNDMRGRGNHSGVRY